MPRGLTSGQLRHRVTIQRTSPTLTVGSMGQPNMDWSDVASVWAAISPLSGRDLLLAQQLKADVSHKITMRGGISITPKDRIDYEGRIFSIESVINVDEYGSTLELMCVERVIGK